jgi:hypothetical protein
MNTGFKPKRIIRSRPDIAKMQQRGKGPVYDTLDKKKSEPRRVKKRIDPKHRFAPQRRREFMNQVREPSVKVQTDWKVIEQFELSQFGKLQTTTPVAEDLAWCGYLQKYDFEFDKVTTKVCDGLGCSHQCFPMSDFSPCSILQAPKLLQKVDDRQFFTVSTTSGIDMLLFFDDPNWGSLYLYSLSLHSRRYDRTICN